MNEESPIVASSTFNEPESFLLRKWADARLLEKSMKAIREKYGAVLERVLDAFQEKYPELNARDLLPSGEGLNIGVGKRAWKTVPKYRISGFWLGQIRIEDLTSEQEAPPDKTVFVSRPDIPINLEGAKKKILAAANVILTNEELRRADHENFAKGCVGITFPILQSRSELFELLMKDDSRGFVSCMVGHLEEMTKFIPTLDDVFRTKSARK